MANEQVSGKGGNVGSKSAGNSAGGNAVVRNRKVYDHKMTPAERFSLQTVQRAQAALKVVNDAIKSGQKPDAELITLCTTIAAKAGSILYPES
jgi:hypothetical protein